MNLRALITKTLTMLLALLICRPPVWADDRSVLLTLDEYVNTAVKSGIQSNLNNLSLESAGYTREIAFRQTDSPAFTLNRTDSKGETTFNGFPELTNSQLSSLNMNEVTPLGTTVNASGQWFYDGGTAGPVTPVARPGFTVNVTQPIYIFVKNSVKRTRQEADLNFAGAKSTFHSTILGLRAQARSLYYNIMLEGESVQADEQKVASSQKLLAVTQALVDAGKSAPVETMRAKIQLQDDQRQLENDQVLEQQSILQAKNFALMPLEENVRFVTPLPFTPFTLSQERLIQFALLHNPTLDSLRINTELARLNYEATIEATRPTFSVNGTYSSADARTEPDYIQRGWTWTSTINWLFFDSFVTKDRGRIARIAQWVADLNLKDAGRTTQANVQSEYLSIKRTEKQIQDFKFSKDQAQRNVEVLRLRFQNGLAGLLDVLDAEDQMKALDNEYLELLVQFNQAKDQLSEQLGVEVETLEIQS